VQLRRGFEKPKWRTTLARWIRKAIAQVGRRILARRAATPMSLHDALLTLILLPPSSQMATPYFEQLRTVGRAVLLPAPGEFWAADRTHPTSTSVPRLVSRSCSPARLVGFDRANHSLDSSRPLSLSARNSVDIALAQLEGEGQILRGRFTAECTPPDQIEWCNRRILSRASIA